MLVDVERILYASVFRLVNVIVFEEILQVLQVAEHLVISQEMHDILVNHSEFLLLVFLLVLENKVVKENLVQPINILLNQKLNPLNCRFLIFAKTDLLSIKFLNDFPKLLERVAAQRRWSITFFGLKLFLLKGFRNVFIDLHVFLN